MTLTHPTLGRMTAALLLGASALALPACRGDRSDKPPRQFLPDMDDSPKYKAQTKTDFFSDGRAMRPTVFGTVAYGEQTGASHDEAAAKFDPYLRADRAFFTGKTGEGAAEQYVENLPGLAVEALMAADGDRLAAAERMLDRGEDRFKVYCSVCHGFDGKGYGMVGMKWGAGNLSANNFHGDQYQKNSTTKADPKQFRWRDGFLFWTIRNGVPKEGSDELKMPAYGHAINEKDAWAVVAYIRAMQDAYSVPLSSDRISPTDREKLKTTRPTSVPGAGVNPANPPAGGSK
ncbi:MAG: c-type cytochrome [Phycisphaerales bacterium]